MDLQDYQVFKQLTLLYLEDDERVRDSLLLTLKELFLEVIDCENAAEALAHYQERHPDLLLIDIHMAEGVDGLELVKKIRSQDTHTPIIVASAHGTVEYFQRAIPLMLVDFLVKPFDLDALLKVFQAAYQQILRVKQSGIDKKLIFFPNGSCYDSLKQCLWEKNGQRIDLHQRELLLLEFFVNNRLQPLSHADIFNAIWDSEEVSDITLRTLINKLRTKIGKEAIVTLTGYGYRLEIAPS